MHCHQLYTAARPTNPADNARYAATYGRTAVRHRIDRVEHRLSDEGVDAQWTACRVAAQSDGYHIPESSDFLFGDDGVSGRASRRPELARLLDVVRSGDAPFSRLYVTDVARLSRDEVGFSFLHRFKNDLALHGIELHLLAGDGASTEVTSLFPSLEDGACRPTG